MYDLYEKDTLFKQSFDGWDPSYARLNKEEFIAKVHEFLYGTGFIKKLNAATHYARKKAKKAVFDYLIKTVKEEEEKKI